MLRHPQYTRRRIAQLTERFESRIYADAGPLEALLVSPRVERISYDEARRLTYRPANLGERFGPLYATFWFKARAVVPHAWAGSRVDLLWSTHSEATLWVHGRSVQGLNHSADQNHLEAPLIDKARGGESIEFLVEMACNSSFGSGGVQWPEHDSPIFLDRSPQIGRFDPLAWDLFHDLLVLTQLEAMQETTGNNEAFTALSGGTAASQLEADWAGRLIGGLNAFANAIDDTDRRTWKPAQRILKGLLKHRNGTAAHELSAIGHAHIDTAWLWPLAETHRKCVRSFSTAASYMDDYPEYRFACSQAYQYDVIKRTNPDLYERIGAKVKAGQWVPVGGTWVEPDCNLPSGESLVRQFLVGQRFFEREFGRRCAEFWNPDVFGYNGQLPQIMRLAGIERFLTQKLSWNAFNKPMHHTFAWEGLDGSRVLAHFPPADTYNGRCTIAELRKHARNYKDADRGRHALYLFGHGDGGGGPTRTMLEVLRRTRDLQGVPRCAIRSSDEFFGLLEKDVRDLPAVVGELYFELHRGTYTSQASTKRHNRKCEFLLHDCEFLAAVAGRVGDFSYPKDRLDRMWEVVLLNQFHDVLPGSSVRQVYEVTERQYAEVTAEGEAIRAAALEALRGRGTGHTPVNTTGFPRAEVAERPDGSLAFVEAPSYGLGRESEPEAPVRVTRAGDRVTLDNGLLRAVLSRDGRVLSLRHLPTRREALEQPGNVLEIAEDRPTMWDAWDVDPFHLETLKPCEPAESWTVARRDPLRAEVAIERKIGAASSMRQTVRLDAGAARLEFQCEIDWRESHKILKVAFPVAVRSMHATYEMQFGSVERPTHFNDPAALARFEVPGHKWADLSEHGFGVALLSESKYGFSTLGNVMRMSLLRSPKSPDPQADMGMHRFAYALMPHAGDWRQGGVVAEGCRFNAPLLWTAGRPPREGRSFLAVDDPNLVIDTVKRAEDSEALVVRLYECHGARGAARLKLGLPFKRATRVNILEDRLGSAALRGGEVEVPYRPHQIVTLVLS